MTFKRHNGRLLPFDMKIRVAWFISVYTTQDQQATQGVAEV